MYVHVYICTIPFVGTWIEYKPFANVFVVNTGMHFVLTWPVEILTDFQRSMMSLLSCIIINVGKNLENLPDFFSHYKDMAVWSFWCWFPYLEKLSWYWGPDYSLKLQCSFQNDICKIHTVRFLCTDLYGGKRYNVVWISFICALDIWCHKGGHSDFVTTPFSHGVWHSFVELNTVEFLGCQWR